MKFEEAVKKANLKFNGKFTYIENEKSSYFTVVCPYHEPHVTKFDNHLKSKYRLSFV